ncbi:hypothetical protein [Nostoc punctiforme]|uniref:hypothetical protein n=1 Tax=Nostoc punctiforme TaxID=272131 RepID=UPI000045BBCE|nr:hypothetical protein [Nostoc punctiforme]
MGQALHGKKEEHFLHPKSKLVYCDRNNLAHPLSLQWRICHELSNVIFIFSNSNTTPRRSPLLPKVLPISSNSDGAVSPAVGDRSPAASRG